VIPVQFCLKLSLLAALPACYGGLNGQVVYIDAESKFSSRRCYIGPAIVVISFNVGTWYVISHVFFLRMIEIGESSFPQIFRMEGLAQKVYSFLSL
jgi:RAD51-like protein 1